MLRQSDNPWLGLASYEYDDAYRFFGREDELQDLKIAISNNLFTTIYGISGAGKTSLINAGLIPALEKENYLPVRIRLDHNSSIGYNTQIIQAVKTAVETKGVDIDYLSDIDENAIDEDERLWFLLFNSKFWSNTNHQIIPVVFIDQFEEIFTLSKDSDQIKSFFESINSLQNNIPPKGIQHLLYEKEGYVPLNEVAQFRMVFSLREDFLARLEDYSYDIPALRKNRKGIKRMNGFQALEVIQKPLPEFVSRDLALQVLEKVVGVTKLDASNKSLTHLSVDTSILSLFCSELFIKTLEAKQDQLSKKLVNQFGNNIISEYYEETIKLVPQRVARYLEKHLLTYSGFRNSVALEDIVKNIQVKIDESHLKVLSAKRLIRIETVEGVERVEFTHDVLCKVVRDKKNVAKNKAQNRFTQSVYVGYFLSFLLLSLLPDIHWMHRTFEFDSPRFYKLMMGTVFSIFSIYIFNRNWNTNQITLKSAFALFISYFVLLLFNSNYFFYFASSPLSNFSVWATLPLLIIFFVLRKNNRISRLKFYIKRLVLILMVSSVAINACFLPFHLLLPLSVFLFFPLALKCDRTSYMISGISASIFSIYSTLVIIESIDILEDFEIIFLCLYSIIVISLLLFTSCYGLLKLKVPKTMTLRESLKYCLSCEIYNEYPVLKKIFTFFASLFILYFSFKIGLALNDEYTLLGIPVLGTIIFVLLYNLLFYNNVKFDDILDFLLNPFIGNSCTVEKISTRAIGKLMLLPIILLAIASSQYFPYHLLGMIAIWIIAIVYFISLSKKRLQNASYSHSYKSICLFFLWAVAFVGIPVLAMGYNVFSKPLYSRVYDGTLAKGTPALFLKIKDPRGNVGLMDRNNWIIPPKYKEILDVDMRINMLEDFSYPYNLLATGNNNRYIDLPDIEFSLMNQNGETEIWKCSNHLQMHNMATSMILMNYKDLLIKYQVSHDLKKAALTKFLSANTDLDQRKKEVDHLLLDVLYSYEIDPNATESTPDQFTSLLKCLETTSLMFPYATDSINNNLLTLLSSSEELKYASIRTESNIPQWCILAKQYDKAMNFAEKTIRKYSSPHLLSHVYMIESLYLSGQTDRAENYLDAYINDDVYLFDYDYQSFVGVDTIKGSNPFDKRIFVRDALYNDMMMYKDMGLLKDTTSAHYHEFMSKISGRPQYDYAYKYVSFNGEHSYYLCRKSNLVGNNQGYKYFIYNNEQASPCYYRFAHSLDDRFSSLTNMTDTIRMNSCFDKDILLVIDELNSKRKYIDFSKGYPRTLPGEYEHAWRFSEGLAVVFVDGKLGVINNEGTFTILPQFEPNLKNSSRQVSINRDKYGMPSSLNVDYVFRNGLCPMGDSSGKYGFINAKGEWVVDPEYDYISFEEGLLLYTAADDFISEGYYAYKYNSESYALECNYLDLNGKSCYEDDGCSKKIIQRDYKIKENGGVSLEKEID